MHPRFELVRALILALLFIASPCLPEARGQANVQATLRSASDRKLAPELGLEDSSGKPVMLKNYRGEVVLLDFWATWCDGCKEEIPWFSEFQRKYSDQGFRVVGVSLDDDGWNVVKPFIKAEAVPYRVALGSDALAKTYDITNMPDAFLIDRDGKIAATYVGLVDRENLEHNIRELLGQ